MQSDGKAGNLHLPGSVWFLEARSFTSAWHKHDLTVDDLIRLQDQIAPNPAGSPVISGTGGLRKIRFAPPARNQGKRGAFRVCYAYFERYSGIVLLLVFPKNRKDSLTAAEKKAFKTTLESVDKEFQQKFGY